MPVRFDSNSPYVATLQLDWHTSLCKPLDLVLFFVLIFLLTPSISFASDYGTVMISGIRTIYDGDTFKVNINQWLSLIGGGVSVRVKGIDISEIRGGCQAEKMPPD
jgi:endonuclease YncB( thermonuclease family)